MMNEKYVPHDLKLFEKILLENAAISLNGILKALDDGAKDLARREAANREAANTGQDVPLDLETLQEKHYQNLLEKFSGIIAEKVKPEQGELKVYSTATHTHYLRGI